MSEAAAGMGSAVVLVTVRLEGMGNLQAAALHQFSIREDHRGIPLCHEPTVVEHEDARTEIQNHFQVVACENAGILEFAELVDQLASRSRIQVR